MSHKNPNIAAFCASVANVLVRLPEGKAKRLEEFAEMLVKAESGSLAPAALPLTSEEISLIRDSMRISVKRAEPAPFKEVAAPTPPAPVVAPVTDGLPTPGDNPASLDRVSAGDDIDEALTQG